MIQEQIIVVGNNSKARGAENNSNESPPPVGDLNLCDIMSSFPSCGSHSISASLAKRPLLTYLQKTHSSMGFPDTASFKQAAAAAQPRNSAGPGFLSQRSDTSKLRPAAAPVPKAGEKRSFQMKRTTTSTLRSCLGGTKPQSSQIKTKKPKQNIVNARIISLNSSSHHHGFNTAVAHIGKK